eukprot:Pgem_evm1s3132
MSNTFRPVNLITVYSGTSCNVEANLISTIPIPQLDNSNNVIQSQGTCDNIIPMHFNQKETTSSFVMFNSIFVERLSGQYNDLTFNWNPDCEEIEVNSDFLLKAAYYGKPPKFMYDVYYEDCIISNVGGKAFSFLTSYSSNPINNVNDNPINNNRPSSGGTIGKQPNNEGITNTFGVWLFM